MREAVIVSTARTPIGKAYRGAFNDTQAQELAGHAIGQAISRAGIAAGQIGVRAVETMTASRMGRLLRVGKHNNLPARTFGLRLHATGWSSTPQSAFAQTTVERS